MNCQEALQSLDDFVENEYPSFINRIKSIDNFKEPIQIKKEIEKYQFPEYLEGFKSLGISKVNEVISFLNDKIQGLIANYGEEYAECLSGLSKKSIGPFEEKFKNRLKDYNSLQKYFSELNFDKKILRYAEFVNGIDSFLELFEDFYRPYCKNGITQDNLQDFNIKVKQQKRIYKRMVEEKATRDSGIRKNIFYVHGLSIIENIEKKIIDIYDTRKKIIEKSDLIKDSIRNNEFSYTDLESRFTNYENEDFLKNDIKKYKSLVNNYNIKKDKCLIELERKRKKEEEFKENQRKFEIEKEKIKLENNMEQNRNVELYIKSEELRNEQTKKYSDEAITLNFIDSFRTSGDFGPNHIKSILKGENSEGTWKQRLESVAKFIHGYESTNNIGDINFYENLHNLLKQDSEIGYLSSLKIQTGLKQSLIDKTLTILNDYVIKSKELLEKQNQEVLVF